MIHSYEDIPTRGNSFILNKLLGIFEAFQTFPKPFFLIILNLLDKTIYLTKTFFSGTFSCWNDNEFIVALRFKANKEYDVKFGNNTTT